VFNDKNSLFDRGSIGEMAMWVKGKTSQQIVVMDKRVQRILAIEAKAGQVEGNWMELNREVNFIT
jgi:hypothetical protein